MPYKNDTDINKRLHEHLLYYLDTYDKDWFVICAQGSMNYGVMDEESDVDSKVLLIPQLEDIIFNRKPISNTLEMPDNNEHVDCKDVREYFKIFRKSNINFVEILFTDYWIVNNKYQDLWLTLRKNAESLARMNRFAAVSCMGGMAHEKFKGMTHEYPSRMHVIEKFGYDPKQLSHLVRIFYFVQMYINGIPYKDCIYPKEESIRNFLLQLKRDGNGLDKQSAIDFASATVDSIDKIVTKFRLDHDNHIDEEMDELLDSVLYNIMCRSLKEQLNKN